ncbi:MAG: hypothetical protein HY890_05605 [Deltaproteobacteria bacterium]|nr:hypothetical protein [Deltaproteobacteria bacterium]
MQTVDELKTGVTGEGLKMESLKVSFTPEQQAKVDELIDGAYRKAYSRAQKNSAPGGEVESLRKEVESLRGDRKMAEVLRVVARHNVVDPEEVADFISRRVTLDSSGRAVVVADGSNGASDGRAAGLEEYVAEWLNSRPHHLRPSSTSGGASTGARFTEGLRPRYNLGDPDVWRRMPREDLDRFLRDGVDVRSSAGQVFRFKDVQNPFLEARRKKFRTGG